ncbi:sodium:calcium antiporter [Bacillus chungangensis]|uniref:Cation:H+ antiporter n=1 Tax=Bacillus chungangensis TaxID=587633 RepID=A0ABT9WST9_9BACI|nr:sodium:calcium antiporter [Bacillus chungangensis]MDQ0176366.1 cation:H+ antiporter [Bacillus chungangensis]
MVYFIFSLCAIVTVIAAMKLSTYADVLSKKTSLGGMLIGTVFLAGATSLPEVTTSLSAVIIHNPDIAVGNVLGSNMFNLFILAMFDLYFRKQQFLREAEKEHFYTAGIGLVLAITSLIALKLKLNITVLGIGIDTLLIIVIYGVGMFVLTNLPKTDNPVHREMKQNDSNDTAISLKKAIWGFTLAAMIILMTGTILSIAGDKIAVITGLGSSFVGSFLIAATTSLPEAVSVLIAIRLGNDRLAIGSILGSNMFNMLILSGSDILFRKGAILAHVSSVHQITAAAVSVLSIIILFSLTRKKQHSSFIYALPSLLLIILYFISSYFIFSY